MLFCAVTAVNPDLPVQPVVLYVGHMPRHVRIAHEYIIKYIHAPEKSFRC